ncbi:unnamed protein product, partial [Nesidiocoris tenuis]
NFALNSNIRGVKRQADIDSKNFEEYIPSATRPITTEYKAAEVRKILRALVYPSAPCTSVVCYPLPVHLVKPAAPVVALSLARAPRGRPFRSHPRPAPPSPAPARAERCRPQSKDLNPRGGGGTLGRVAVAALPRPSAHTSPGGWWPDRPAKPRGPARPLRQIGPNSVLGETSASVEDLFFPHGPRAVILPDFYCLSTLRFTMRKIACIETRVNSVKRFRLLDGNRSVRLRPSHGRITSTCGYAKLRRRCRRCVIRDSGARSMSHQDLCVSLVANILPHSGSKFQVHDLTENVFALETLWPCGGTLRSGSNRTCLGAVPSRHKRQFRIICSEITGSDRRMKRLKQEQRVPTEHTFSSLIPAFLCAKGSLHVVYSSKPPFLSSQRFQGPLIPYRLVEKRRVDRKQKGGRRTKKDQRPVEDVDVALRQSNSNRLSSFGGSRLRKNRQERYRSRPHSLILIKKVITYKCSSTVQYFSEETYREETRRPRDDGNSNHLVEKPNHRQSCQFYECSYSSVQFYENGRWVSRL